MQKFTLSAEFVRQLPEMKGQVYTADIPNPEPPKQVRPTAQFDLCLLFVKKVDLSGNKVKYWPKVSSSKSRSAVKCLLKCFAGMSNVEILRENQQGKGAD